MIVRLHFLVPPFAPIAASCATANDVAVGDPDRQTIDEVMASRVAVYEELQREYLDEDPEDLMAGWFVELCDGTILDVD